MFEDERGGRLAVVAHCILNQNSRVSGLSERAGMIVELVELFAEHKLAVIQMPCPELKYAGILREGKSKDQYDTSRFRGYCRRIGGEIVHQIKEYSECGIRTEVIVGVEGSPSCGVGKKLQEKMEEEHRNEGVSGVLMEELYSLLKEEKLSIPFYEIGYTGLAEDLANIKSIVEG